ncbi:MAG: DNA primase [candidate division WOR-3 bacterium]|nr:DNA primase [candidate division WOR-3 bacterium]MCX7837516.1 DNA primase [candidate division WOR-3 bacterium]MDW8113388.1 DNA primase [candidate division WOR-3 bacterium]
MVKREIIEKILENCDIVELINSYLPLKKVGQYYRTLCPFHHDTKPSFYVNPSQQLFHCFGCKESGNAIHFIMKYEKMEFLEAVKFLAERAGISLKEEREDKKNQGIYEVVEFACNFYHEQLFIYPQALNYLTEKRRLSLATIKEFQLGYAPPGNLLIKVLKKRGYPEELLIESGVAYKKEGEIQEWFFNRIIFPIFNRRGKVIGFGGRVFEEEIEPKYLNSPETLIFKKGENLYGFYQTSNFLTKNKPILVEGYFDLLSLFDKGIKNLAAPLGTGFTIEQAKLLKKYCEEVIILFDGDNAGREATKRVIEIALKASLNPLIALLPDGYDPDKYVNEKGAEELKKIINTPYDLIDFHLKISTPQTISEKRNVLKQLLETINFTCDSALKELYLNKISETFNISKKQVLRAIEKDYFIFKDIEFSTLLRDLEFTILNVLINYPKYIVFIEEYNKQIFSEEIKEAMEIIKEFKDKEKITVGLIFEAVKNPTLKKRLSLISFLPQELIKGIKEEDFKELLNKYLYNYYLKKCTSGEIDENTLGKIYEIKRKLIKGEK